MKNVVYVDPDGKPSETVFNTISEAIDNIRPNTTIKITSGNYTESLKVK